MTKFVNKKEQVYDLQLTTYGRKMLSVSSFKPTYYAFFDDNVVYDNQYTGQTNELQNNINSRIKSNTQYIGSLTLFEDLETTVLNNRGDAINYFNLNGMEDKFEPAKDIYRFDAALGDAFLDGGTQTAPAWKVVALQSMISASNTRDNANDTNIPQIDITATYNLTVSDLEFDPNPETPRDIIDTIGPFGDGKQIVLEMDDPLIYLEEINTQLLMENFEIEVFGVPPGDSSRLGRKYFKKNIPQIENGFMISAQQQEVPLQSLTTGSVEYYFDVLVDHEISPQSACKGAEVFNKQTYYIDLDFDCEKLSDDFLYFDIYGAVTEPEICQD